MCTQHSRVELAHEHHVAQTGTHFVGTQGARPRPYCLASFVKHPNHVFTHEGNAFDAFIDIGPPSLASRTDVERRKFTGLAVASGLGNSQPWLRGVVTIVKVHRPAFPTTTPVSSVHNDGALRLGHQSTVTQECQPDEHHRDREEQPVTHVHRHSPCESAASLVREPGTLWRESCQAFKWAPAMVINAGDDRQCDRAIYGERNRRK